MVEPIVVSYSELDCYRQCPLKHHITYGQRWTKPVKDGSALDKGSKYHAVMETHYKVIQAAQQANNGKRLGKAQEKMVLAACWEAIKPMLRDPTSGAQTEVQELIEWMYKGYVANYGVDRQWVIKGVEHQIITPLRDERGRRSRYHLKAKMDLIVLDLDMGSLWVVDHKSGKDLPTSMDLEIDDQFGLYTWAMREVGRPVMGSIHSANRTQRNVGDKNGTKLMSYEQRMSRTPLNRGSRELDNLALDAYRVARAAHPPKSEQRPVYSSPDPRQCGWKCDVKEPHLAMRTGRRMSEVLTEFGFKIDRTRH